MYVNLVRKENSLLYHGTIDDIGEAGGKLAEFIQELNRRGFLSREFVCEISTHAIHPWAPRRRLTIRCKSRDGREEFEISLYTHEASGHYASWEHVRLDIWADYHKRERGREHE